MLTRLYYMFVPTPALIQLDTAQVDPWGVESGIWSVDEHDRVGADYSQAEVEHAFWTVFLAQAAAISGANFRDRCMTLGFAGCWTVHTAGFCDPAALLLKEAESIRTKQSL